MNQDSPCTMIEIEQFPGFHLVATIIGLSYHTCIKERPQRNYQIKDINPLSPDIHLQLLQTDFHTFP